MKKFLTLTSLLTTLIFWHPANALNLGALQRAGLLASCQLPKQEFRYALAGVPFFLKAFERFADLDAKKYPELAKFIKRYSITQAFKEALEYCASDKEMREFMKKATYTKALAGLNPRVENGKVVTDKAWVKDWIRPVGEHGVYLKDFDISRVIAAIRIQKFLEDYDLNNYITVPKKGIAKVNGQWRVFAQEVRGTAPAESENDIPLEMAKRLYVLGRKTGLCDLHGGNWKWLENNKFGLLDLDLANPKKYSAMLLTHQIQNFINLDVWLWLLQEALAIDNTIASAIVNNIEILLDNYIPTSLYHNYSDPDIDFEQVKKEFYDLLREEAQQEEDLD